MSKLSVEKVSADESRNLPVFAEFDEIADRIRNRAYKLFEDRGFAAAGVFSSRGDLLYVAMRGSRTVERRDLLDELLHISSDDLL